MTLRRSLPLACIVLAAAILWPSLAHAQAGFFERLVMPGELIEGHAKLQTDCKNCHEPFSKLKQSELCAGCHKKVQADIKGATGFHGRRPDVRQVECKHCHTDHKGKKADVVRLDADTFDHNVTDFPLKGAHQKTKCAGCHTAPKKHRDAPSTCFDCHRKDDRHKGALGQKCAGCHNEQSWRTSSYDHSKTRFPLVGVHVKVACAACHANERYKETPMACADCHRLNDAHRGGYGKKCETCHSPAGWKRIGFDHDKQTKYPLTGRHRQATCDSCHKGQIYTLKLKTDCLSCHQRDDNHRGRNGPKCESCHSTAAWKEVRFDHNRDTKFPLRGKHATVKCDSCHRGDVRTEKPQSACVACHKADDRHKGQLGTRCDNCHNETGWRAKVQFNHDLTRFPLIGLHATAPCEACHATTAYKDTSMVCATCHRDDDVHKARLGPNCGQCHNPNGWALWRFDHNRQTRFPIDGAHVKVHCDSCHTRPVADRVSVSSACVDCHQKDDIHRGGFGPNCERCHVTESFRKIRQR